MDLPRSNSKLDEIFLNASIPRVSEFEGEYIVDMLTILPSLKRFSHRKVFFRQDDKTTGHNLLFRNKRWGRFILEQGLCPGFDQLKVVVVDYNQPENTFISNGIKDFVRCIEPKKLYLGRFNSRIMGRLRFLGYFSLSRVIK